MEEDWREFDRNMDAVERQRGVSGLDAPNPRTGDIGLVERRRRDMLKGWEHKVESLRMLERLSVGHAGAVDGAAVLKLALDALDEARGMLESRGRTIEHQRHEIGKLHSRIRQHSVQIDCLQKTVEKFQRGVELATDPAFRLNFNAAEELPFSVGHVAEGDHKNEPEPPAQPSPFDMEMIHRSYRMKAMKIAASISPEGCLAAQLLSDADEVFRYIWHGPAERGINNASPPGGYARTA